MVVAFKAVGGVGNQIFQYCLARRLADKNHDRLIVDTSYYLSHKHCIYELDKFNIRLDTPLPEDNLVQFQLVEEATMSFIPEVLELKGNIVLSGYWQSPKYLKDSIVSELPNIDVSYPCDSESYKNACVIHVRGNDYKGWKLFDVCTYEYYNRAVAFMKECRINRFYVITDDRPYAEHLLYDVMKDKSNTVVFPPTRGVYDILEISKYDSMIGANSTFSYWGYKLGYHDLSVFPNKWFGESSKNDQINLYEDMMILISP
jgi:hypothetical protein